MGRNELLDQLALLKQSGDPEAAHSTADDMLLDYINDEAITEAFNDVPKWYA